MRPRPSAPASDPIRLTARHFAGRVWQLTRPYFASEERWIALGLLAAVVALELAVVFMAVWISDANKAIFDAMENKDLPKFWRELGDLLAVIAVFIVVAIYKLYLRQGLEMRWRLWLTRAYLGLWMSDQRYYHLELLARGRAPDPNAARTDNPDQRIAEDLKLFVSGSLSLSLGLLSAVVTLASFVGILAQLSGSTHFTLGGMTVTVPYYMVWVAIAYASVGSWLAHKVGRKLIPLSFNQQRYEADFRYALVRLRENAEGVALYRGEATELSALDRLIGSIRENWWALMRVTKRYTAYNAGYAQIGSIFPLVVAAPRYFAGNISLGDLMQTRIAFGEVDSALSWFINAYPEVADWKASVDRLLSFHDAADGVEHDIAGHEGIRQVAAQEKALHAHLRVALPDGTPLLAQADLRLVPGARVLVSGASGCGKSTLLRALSGIWPFGAGEVALPDDARVLFLPQKPYLPVGSLRAAASYPHTAGFHDDGALREALQACGLAQLAERLDEEANWAQRLSGGEQQRLALARALLCKPDYLFLDEATSAQDEAHETRLYQLLDERLPDCAVLSIAHRTGVRRFHRQHWVVLCDAQGTRLVGAA